MLVQRNCKLCGKPFLAEGRNMYCKDTHYGICEVCGKRFVINDIHYPERTCSPECRGKLRKKNAEQTSLKRYGVKNAGGTAESKAKVQATCREKYGVDWPGQAEIQKQHVRETFEKNGGNPMQRQECKEKSEKTCIEKYGAKNPLCKDSSIREYIYQKAEEKYGTRDPGNLPEFREKAKQTSLKNYGTEYYFQSETGKEAKKAGMLAHYGVDHPMHSPEIIQKIKDNSMKKYGVDCPMKRPEVMQKMIENNMKKYGVPFYCMHEKCRAAQGSQPSKIAESFADKLKTLSGKEIEYEYRIGRRSFDIHILDSNVLIEIDPTYTHSTVPVEKFGSIKANSHKEKTDLAEENGMRCIHVFSWDNEEKIIGMFIDKETVYARKCKLLKIDQKTANEFLDDYHLQGSCKGQEFCYGLYYECELVEIMTFGKPRYNKNFEWELLRLCTANRVKVIGGASRLFKAFLDEVNPQSIVSYCDRAKFSGNVYSTIGFDLGDKGTPSKHWSKSKEHITDNLLRQRGYDQLFGTSYGKGTSNEELMLQNKWLPIYDCGQARYEWRAS